MKLVEKCKKLESYPTHSSERFFNCLPEHGTHRQPAAAVENTAEERHEEAD